jgi:ATP-dependent 26S proteasome regulatory subunit
MLIVSFIKSNVLTENFTGSDLANLVNTAGMIAAKNNRNQVESTDFKASLEKIQQSRISNVKYDSNHPSNRNNFTIDDPIVNNVFSFNEEK